MTLFGLALRFLKWRGVATTLNILCVAFAVGLIVALESVPAAIISGSLEPSVRAPILVAKGESSSRLVMASIFLEPPVPQSLPATLVDIVSKESGIREVIPLKIDEGKWGAEVATTRAYFQQGQSRLSLEKGRIFQPDEEDAAVLGSSVANKVKLDIGRVFEQGNKRLKIVGILSETGTPVDQATFRPFLKQDSTVSALIIIPGEGFSPEALQDHLTEPDARVIEVNTILRRLVLLVSAIGQIINWLVVAVIAMTLVLFCSSVYANMRDRVRDLATLRVIGAQRRSVVALLTLESGIIGLIGAGGGLIIAAVLLALTRNILRAAGFSFLPHLGERSLWFSVAGFLTTMSIGGLIAIAVYKMDPITALSSTNRPWGEVLGEKGRMRIRWVRFIFLLLLVTVPTAVFYPTPPSRPINHYSKQLFDLLEHWEGKGIPPAEISSLNDQVLTVEGYPYLPLEPKLGEQWRSGFFIVRDDPNRPIELFHDHDQDRPEENQRIWVELRDPIEPTFYPIRVQGTFQIQPDQTKVGFSFYYRLVKASAKIIASKTD